MIRAVGLPVRELDRADVGVTVVVGGASRVINAVIGGDIAVTGSGSPVSIAPVIIFYIFILFINIFILLVLLLKLQTKIFKPKSNIFDADGVVCDVCSGVVGGDIAVTGSGAPVSLLQNPSTPHALLSARPSSSSARPSTHAVAAPLQPGPADAREFLQTPLQQVRTSAHHQTFRRG